MGDSQPLVSIILPTFNGSKYLEQAVQSCLNQTYSNIELICINDASDDGTAKQLMTIKDRRIKVIHHDQNTGHIYALNEGFSLSTGDYLTWTSDDNYYAPNALATMVGALVKNKKVDFVYANYHVIDDQGKALRLGRVENPSMLDNDNYVGGCFLYRRRVYEQVGEFRKEAFLAEDYEYWLRVRQQFPMKKLPDTLYYYRLHDRSLTMVHKEKKVQEQVEKIREQYIKVWKKFYFRGRKYFYENNRKEAKINIWKSLLSNPFYYQTWRLLILLYLNKQ